MRVYLLMRMSMSTRTPGCTCTCSFMCMCRRMCRCLCTCGSMMHTVACVGLHVCVDVSMYTHVYTDA